jgi:Secretion system C-terminal sorting domain
MKNYLYFMRLSVAILIAVHQTQAGNCQTLLNENFNYPSGALLTANGWNAHDDADSNSVKVSSVSLVFEGYPASDIGLSALLGNNGEDVNKTFITVTTGNVFCSFLVKVNAIANDYFLHLANSSISSQRGRVYIKGAGNLFNFGLSKGTGNSVYTIGSSFTTGSTYLIILKYSIVEGASNDIVSLYILTGSIPSTEPSTPSIGPLTDAGQTDLNNVSAVALRQYSTKENILVDGIRVATKWEDLVGIITVNENLDMKNNPVVYPVPVSEELTVSNIRNVTMIEIFDITGKKVISVKTEATDNCRIPVNNLLSGIYLLRVTSPGGVKIMRFVKS